MINKNEGVHSLEVVLSLSKFARKISSLAGFEPSTFMAPLCDTTTFPFGLIFNNLNQPTK